VRHWEAWARFWPTSMVFRAFAPRLKLCCTNWPVLEYQVAVMVVAVDEGLNRISNSFGVDPESPEAKAQPVAGLTVAKASVPPPAPLFGGCPYT